MRALVLISFLAACTAPLPPSIPPPPSTPPPAPPPRETAAAPVSGQVLSPAGQPLIRTWITVRAADAACRPSGVEVGAITDDRGEYHALIESGGTTTEWGCVIVEARSGGAAGSASAPAVFDPPSMERRPVRVDVRLNRAPPLTAAEAERLARLLAEEINHSASIGSPELAAYVEWGSEALRVALDHYRTILGRVTHVAAAGSETMPGGPRRYSFELRNAGGRASRLDVYEDGIVRLHSPPIDYGLRMEGFLIAYLRAISSGDAQMLARVLNPDDVEFPLERAREIVLSYRQRYRDLGSIRFELVSVDERRNSMTWRLRGTGADGREVVETIELGYGDGLVGVRSSPFVTSPASTRP